MHKNENYRKITKVNLKQKNTISKLNNWNLAEFNRQIDTAEETIIKQKIGQKKNKYEKTKRQKI